MLLANYLIKKMVKCKVIFNERFFLKIGFYSKQQAEHSMRHGVTRKKREVKNKKDMIKLFRKSP